MFCRKCKYTSFDSFATCPLCGYDWGKEKKDLNLHWLAPVTPPSDTGEPGEISQESAPAAASVQARQKESAPAQGSGGTEVGQGTAQQHPPTGQDAGGNYQPGPPGEQPAEPAENSDLQEIEYSFEDVPSEPESGYQARASAAKASSSDREEEITFQLDDSEEIEIGLEEDESQRDHDSGGDARPGPGNGEATQAEGGEEDDDWSAFIEEIELDSFERFDQDSEKSK